MKGVVFTGNRTLEIRDFADPTPGPRDVILEIKASGMCGSDLHRYRAEFTPGDTSSGFAMGDEPMIAGHCLLYTSPSPRDRTRSRMPSSA